LCASVSVFVLAACAAHPSSSPADANPLDAGSPVYEGPPTDARVDLECPLADAGCPDGCHEVIGQHYDREHDCLEPVAAFTCSRQQFSNDQVECFVDSDGEIYQVPGSDLYHGSHPRWRLCTTAERRLLNAPDCAPADAGP
jgi:hypothetical protein